MVRGMNTQIHIFRAGRHTAMSGRVIAFAEADVAQVAASYDPAVHEAPIVVGHPATDDPAFGWVGALRAEGGDLIAEPRQVEPAFAEMVRAGRFRKVSASFYPPEASSNPAPGKWYLKHVGFLGAQAPAVKGLRPAEFADDGEAVTLEVDFSEAEVAGIAAAGFGGVRRVIAALRDWLLSSQGQETADRIVPAHELEYIRTTEEFMRNQIGPEAPAPSFAETGLSRRLNALIDAAAEDDAAERSALIGRMAEAAGIERGTVLQILRGEIETPPEERLRGFARALDVSADELLGLVSLAEGQEKTMPQTKPDTKPDADELARREAEIAAREAAFAERETAFAEAEAARRKAEDTALVDKLVTEGRVAPGLKDPMVAFLGAIDAEEEVAFAEGAKTTPRDWFRDLLGRAKPLIEFGEVSAPDGAQARISGHQDITAAARRLVKQAEEDGRTLSFAEAVREVETQMEITNG